jgi:hypothetical protein
MGSMGTKKKTPDVLDGMIEHVRYEVLQVLDFVRLGNASYEVLDEDLRLYAQPRILEAGLIHFRCLVEFLDEAPKSDQVMARDYLHGWEWKATHQLVRVADLHGRLAHLGTLRVSVATSGDFKWSRWLNEQAPTVLDGFREFLIRLRQDDPRRYELFRQPRPTLPAVDLLTNLDSVLS